MNYLKNYNVGCRPHTTRSFCFGKRTQNHFRPCAALRVPPPPSRIKMAAQLAPLKQCSPEGSIRYCGSAAPNAGDTQETNQVFKLGSNSTKTHFPFIFRNFPKIILSLGSKSLPDFPVVQNNYTRCTSKCVLRGQW